MRATEPIRLALIGLIIVLFQLAVYTKFPGMRAGADFFVLFVLLVTATYGSAVGGVSALFGGLLMDAHGSTYFAFHLLYYVIPVVLGTMFRSQMLMEFRMLGALAVLGLLLIKVILQYITGLATGQIGSFTPLFAVNYWSILLTAIAVLILWPKLVAIVTAGAEVKRRRV